MSSSSKHSGVKRSRIDQEEEKEAQPSGPTPSPSSPSVSSVTPRVSCPVFSVIRSSIHNRRHPGDWVPPRSELYDWLDEFHERRKRRLAQKESGISGAATETGSGSCPVSMEKWETVVKNFYSFLQSTPVIRMYVTTMLEQLQYEPAKERQNPNQIVKTVEDFCDSINFILHTAPTTTVKAPLNGFLNDMMDTPSGFVVFADPQFNEHLRNVLNKWAEYLDSGESVYTINKEKDGWMAPKAAARMKITEFQINEKAPHWGFKSWNDFFARRFKEGERPVASPENDKVIVSACESTPFAINYGGQVKYSAQFWIKSQPYSLIDMLGGRQDLAQKFVNGTVYQAFLSGWYYHRWHAPVSGKIVTVEVIHGTYYSESQSLGYDTDGPNNSQAYITQICTRGLLVIDTTGKANIGLVAVIFVGMAEISSCLFDKTIIAGAEIKKGDEVGTFQYGGSSHCVLFQPDVIKFWSPNTIPQQEYDAPTATVKVKSIIALAN